MPHDFSRRSFLKRSATLVAAPMIVSPATLGRAAVAAPNDRITLAFIGTGTQLNNAHVSKIPRFDDIQTLAVCDVDTNRCKNAKRRVDAYEKRKNRDYAGADMTGDYRKIIERGDIDTVCIATPDHWHAQILIEACQAGKDAYCEKPLTLTIREAELCVKAARKHKCVVQTGSQQRSNVYGPFRKACEIVRSGRLGELKRVTVGVGGPSRWCDLPEEPMEPGLDWDFWLGQAPMRPYNSTLSPRGVHKHFPAWRAYREYSGGSLTDMGAHHFDIAQWALGMDESGPVEIHPPGNPNANSGVRLVYPNGVEMIHGGPGGCNFHGANGTLRIDRNHFSSNPPELSAEPIADDEVHLYNSTNHHRDWIDCVVSRKRPVADVEIGARSVTVCHLVSLAYWNQKSYKYDPANWCFDNDEDNKQLDRERRGPWQLPTV